MPAMWEDVTEALLPEAFNARELAAVNEARGVPAADPVPGLCRGIAARIRNAVLAGGRTLLQGGALAIPPALHTEAVSLMRYKLLVRFTMPVTEERKAEVREAEQRLDAIAKGELPLLDEGQQNQATPRPTYHARKQRWNTPPHGGLM